MAGLWQRGFSDGVRRFGSSGCCCACFKKLIKSVAFRNRVQGEATLLLVILVEWWELDQIREGLVAHILNYVQEDFVSPAFRPDLHVTDSKPLRRMNRTEELFDGAAASQGAGGE
ncbi:hypothetical protein OHA59_45285 [Streptomyces sp. NBC_01589]|uniref:hypothetical protein n=1 Tax=Streptomyces sp. NBC_01589 TaxID=2975886 RepID=UPI00386E6DD4